MRNKHNTDREREQIYRGDGRMIGGIVGDVFRKHVDASKHFLRRPPAIAFDREVLTQARAEGAQIAEVIDREGGQTYRAPIARIFGKGFSVNRGSGAQIALALNDWNRSENYAPAHEAMPTQPSLFNLSRLVW